MTVSVWQPGVLYLPGAVVTPTTVPENVITDIGNADFESGNTGWSLDAGFSISQVESFTGDWCLQLLTDPGTYAESENDTFAKIVPGQSVSIKCMVDYGTITPDLGVLLLPSRDDFLLPDGGLLVFPQGASVSIGFRFYDAAYALISTDTGAVNGNSDSGNWYEISHTANAPVNSAYVKAFVIGNATGGLIKFDNFSWDLASTGSGVSSSLIFKATQADSGISGATEPTWPTVVGNTVIDNGVTWEAVEGSTVTWQANSILTSGAMEPTWPTVAGAVVSDGNIAWECVRLHIEDENCPQTREVAIAGSKIFAGDDDVTRFCATLNPRDWTTEEDAGFLPSGLQQKGQVGVTGLGVYRGNLCIWNESNFQVWQVDPDPAAMALLDAMEGIGSAHHKAIQPVSNDLFFLAALGVRTVGVAAGSTNLATGDAGIPIDELVQEALDDSGFLRLPDRFRLLLPNDDRLLLPSSVAVDPIATYYPSAGQYWLAFPPATISTPGTPPTYIDPDDRIPVPLSNCNEIYSIGTLTPDLHCAGMDDLGVWDSGMLQGTGDLYDGRGTGVYVPNNNDMYDVFGGGVVSPSYIIDCQSYIYAGSDHENGLAVPSNNLSGWYEGGIGTKLFIADGINGDPNWATILEDTSVSDTYQVYMQTPFNSINLDGSILSTSLVLGKDVTKSNWSRFVLTSGDPVPPPYVSVLFNQATGEANINDSLGADADLEVINRGDWWEVYLQTRQGSSGGYSSVHRRAWITIYPADSNDGLSMSKATLGSLVVGNVWIADQSKGIGLTRSQAQFPSIGVGSKIISESGIYVPIANHDNTSGGYYIEWRPQYSSTEISGDVEILSLNGGNDLLYYDYSEQKLCSTDGTNIATVDLAFEALTKYRLGVVFGDYLRVGVDGLWGNTKPYDGAYTLGSQMDIFRSPEAQNYWRELRGFQVAYLDAYNEINLLMAG